MNPDTSTPTTSFHTLGIAPKLLEMLDEAKFTVPTPIQHQAIPVAMSGKDVVGIAQTGTGKTLSFALPMLQHLMNNPGRGLIMAPTRELAYQIEETLRKFAPKLGILTAVFIGGASMSLQKQMLKRNPRILVATPGRLNDHLQQGTITLKEVSMVVLDEADRMLDMGFLPQIERIFKHIPKERQTMLFSATMPPSIMKLATVHMKLPLRIEVAPAGTTAERVEQEMFVVQKAEKIRLLEKLLVEYKGTVLVFSRTKHGAKKIMRSIRTMGHTAAELHGNRSLNQRMDALDGFKRGRYRVLVATDIAGRGIDVDNIQLVINFDLPQNPDDYVHRIGRTARAGKEGRAISFAEPNQLSEIRSIERLIRTQITRSQPTGLPPARAGADATQDRDEDRGGRRPSYRPRPDSERKQAPQKTFQRSNNIPRSTQGKPAPQQGGGRPNKPHYPAKPTHGKRAGFNSAGFEASLQNALQDE
ncbi:MAG: ATP-dependent helicase RhlE [Candidatus Peribacteria bacterium]|nr:ATP-dependent helicase RhlE [Candidatus Peribacteria bacterium]